jgi:hypothetical protein
MMEPAGYDKGDSTVDGCTCISPKIFAVNKVFLWY